jgi:hypothetical protein
MNIYRSSEGNRYYRQRREYFWEVLEPDGTWRLLKGSTYVGNIDGRMNLLRYHRGGRVWKVEVIQELNESDNNERPHNPASPA